MINLLEGVPGSGKSYEAVVYHVLPALKMGRKVITNLPLQLDKFAAIDPGFLELIELRKGPMPILGRWDAEAANRGEKAFILGDFSQAPHGVEFGSHRGRPSLPPPPGTRLFASVWDFYDEWRGEGNIGALFVIDECHVSFPKENLRKARFTPDEVIQYFKISRHFGVDVLLMTQRMRALEEDVAGLAEMHIRVRKATFLGRPDQYIRKVFAGLNGGEVQGDEREYKPQFFGLYKSHTQGAAVIEAAASDVAPANVKWRRMSHAMFAIAAIGAVWIGFRVASDKPKPKPATAAPSGMLTMQRGSSLAPPQQIGARPLLAQSVVPQPQAMPAVVSATVPPSDVDPEPMQARGMHFAGCVSMGDRMTCAVTISQNGQPLFTITSKDLQDMGYTFKQTSNCSAVVTWKSTARAVICDLPQIGMAVAGVSAPQTSRTASVQTVPMPDPPPVPENTTTVSQVVADQQRRAENAGYLRASGAGRY